MIPFDHTSPTAWILSKLKCEDAFLSKRGSLVTGTEVLSQYYYSVTVCTGAVIRRSLVGTHSASPSRRRGSIPDADIA